MIVLIDDKKYRKEKNLTSKIEEFNFFKDFLFDKNENIDDQINGLKEAKAIIIHKSYTPYNLKNEELIEKIRQKTSNNIPIILFSGGSTTNSIGTNYQVSATDMYSNLYDFLQYYNANKEIKPAILLYGKNYFKNELISLEYEVWKKLEMYDNDFDLGSNPDLLEDIEIIIDDTIISEELKNDKDKLIDWMEASKKLKVKTLKLVINKFVYRYE